MIDYKQIKTEKLITFVGISRSGQTATLNWILDQMNGPKCWCRLQCNKMEYIDIKTGDINTYNKTIVASFEMNNLEYVNNRIKSENYFHADKHVLIIILRDFFNWSASLIKYWRGTSNKRRIGTHEKNIRTITIMLGLWMPYAKEFLNITNILPDKILLNYNVWCKSKEYRQKISQKFGDHYSDKTLETVALSGIHLSSAGSSFDGLKYQDKASQMPVEHRWMQMMHDELYVDLIKQFIFNDEYIKLFTSIYGETEAFEYFKKCYRI